MPQLDEAGDGEKTEAQRQQTHRRLRRHQQLAPVEMIGRKAAPGQQQEQRAELQRHDDADGGRVVVGQLRQHQPALRRALQPGPDIGDEGAAGPDPVVEAAQRTEGALRVHDASDDALSDDASGVLPP